MFCVNVHLLGFPENIFRKYSVEFLAPEVDLGNIGVQVVVANLLKTEGTVDAHYGGNLDRTLVVARDDNHDLAGGGHDLLVSDEVVEDGPLSGGDLEGNTVDNERPSALISQSVTRERMESVKVLLARLQSKVYEWLY